MVEIRWHGRGGQGAKTASQLLAMAGLITGQSVQAFPEYGPERSGAPMQAYNRADATRIRRHDGVRTPGYVVVLDESLLAEAEVVKGLSPRGLFIVNTEQPPAEVRARTGYGGTVWCVPADRIARRCQSRYANVVLVGALARALVDIPLAVLEEATREILGARLSASALEASLRAVREGFAWAERRLVA